MIDATAIMESISLMRDEEIYAALGQSIAARRKKVPLTQKKLADMVRVSRATIANVERGKQAVSVHNLYAIADALNVEEISELLPPLRRRNSLVDVEVKPNYGSINENEALSVRKWIDSISKTESAKVRK